MLNYGVDLLSLNHIINQTQMFKLIKKQKQFKSMLIDHTNVAVVIRLTYAVSFNEN